jgi:hypothetical protein
MILKARFSSCVSRGEAFSHLIQIWYIFSMDEVS